MKGIQNFIKEMFSMQEKRISTIIICLLASLSLAFYLYLTRMDIPETLLTIITTLIYIVGGVNGTNIIAKVLGDKKKEMDGYDG